MWLRLSALKSLPYMKVCELGVVNDMDSPLCKVMVDDGNSRIKHNVLLSGGVHGDEPAGVWATLEFLEKHAFRYLDQFRFFVYPCVNPMGYGFGGRRSSMNFDLNRDFNNMPKSVETRFLTRQLRDGPKRYAVTLDLHECDPYFEDEEFRAHGFTKVDNPHGFWLWELQNNHSKRVGQKIISEVRGAGIPVAEQPTIFGDVNSDGVIAYPEGRKSSIYGTAASFDDFLHRNYTDHAFTIETNSSWAPERRIQAHLIAVTTVLDEYRKR